MQSANYIYTCKTCKHWDKQSENFGICTAITAYTDKSPTSHNDKAFMFQHGDVIRISGRVTFVTQNDFYCATHHALRANDDDDGIIKKLSNDYTA